MREVTFGHYPPAKDVWTTYRNNPHENYRKDCLYNHYRSRYKHDESGTCTPETPVHAKHVNLRPRSKTPVSPTSSPHILTPSPFQTGKQSPAVAWKKFSPSPPKKQKKPYSPIPVPVKAWSTSVPATPMARPDSVPMTPMARPDSYSLQVEASHVPPSPSQRPSRIQSATTHRHKQSPKPRPVKSAGPTRSSPATRSASIASSEDTKPSRPPAPEPAISPESMTSYDYNNELDMNGWKMEIPGDPLAMKKQCISRRLPYTVQCIPKKEVRDPPGLHVENFDTYFYNTIPRKPLSFTIHQEWASEMLHAQRMELQKREGGIQYRYKNFSFAY